MVKIKSALLAGAILPVLLCVKAQAANFAFDETGSIYFVGANTIFKITSTGTASKFAAAESEWSDSDIAIDRAGNVFVSATTEHPRGGVVDVVVTIFKFTSAGKRSTWVPNAGKRQATGMACDSAGNVYVGIDSLMKTDLRVSIVKITPAGKRSTFAKGLYEPRHMIFDPAGNLFAYDGFSDEILKFSTNGTKSTFAKGIRPYDLACDRSGNLFAADEQKNMIVKFDATGASTTFAEINSPSSLGFDRAGNLLVWGEGGIFKIASDGTKTLFAQHPAE